MPMSASCVVNRAELLDMLSEVREALPGSLAQAQELLGGREQMVTEARQEAQRIIDAARSERESLISGTEVARGSQEESDRILAEARREAAEIQAEADDYVDSKLANFEVVLSKTIGSVDRGRDKLLGRTREGGPSSEEDTPEQDGELAGLPEAPPSDPEVRKQRAEEYIEAQFRAFEAVLAKTLQAVGRGRQKLTGYKPTDELAAHMAAQDGEADRHQVRGSDSDYLADLADTPVAPSTPTAPAAPPQQAVVHQPEPRDVYQQDPYAPVASQTYEGAPQSGYPQESYALPQQDAFAQADPHAPFEGQHGAYGHDQNYPPVPPPPSSPYEPQPQQLQGYQQADYAAYPDNGGHPGYSNQAYPGSPYAGTGYPQPGQQPYPDQTYPGHGQQPGGYEERYADPLGMYDQTPQDAGASPTYPGTGQQQPGALDETSLFDTSMIDMQQLRRYEDGH